ncbi:MAG: UvrD-helicase domain-containing protein [Chthoniobacterales bacterium]
MPLLIQRASAGSGKTEQLARHYLQILFSGEACGISVDPSTILAATFTREAAGEILARILKMLAMGCQERRLCERIVEGTKIPIPTSLECRKLLKRLVTQIHRLRIGTIDALFAQQARAFVLDLGLTPGWEIADALTSSQLARRTVLRLLQQHSLFAHDWKVMHHFKRTLSFVTAAATLLERNRALVHSTPWEEAPEEKGPPKRLSAEELEAIQEFLIRFQVPTTRKGKPNGIWIKALQKIKDSFSQPLYLKDVLEQSPLFFKLLEEEPRFYGKEIPAEFIAFFSPLVQASHVEQHRLSLLREGALWRLVQSYHTLRGHSSFQAGRYTFSEIEEIVSASSLALSKEEMEFRMDLRTEHLLLDEYQDTSERQHAFLVPLMEDVLAKGGSVFIVGDVKQGIYGWRGGRRHFLGLLEKEYEPYLVKKEPLHQSYRSSPAVLKAVNHVFESLKNKETVELMQAGEAFEEAAARWSRDFQPQESAVPVASLRGEVMVHEISVRKGMLQEEIMQRLIETVVELVEAHRKKDPLRENAVLVRRTKFIPMLLLRLRERGIIASGEGGNPLADTLAVEVLLSLLSWIDHPGNTAAYEHVKNSPLADLVTSTTGGALREMLMEHGYARSLRDWTSQTLFQKACSDYEQARVEQFIEMAHRFDARGGGTPSELVKKAREERVESPLSHGVRVLSMHAAKGLEFESVILMDLDTSIFGGSQNRLRVQTTADGKFFIQNSQELMALQGRENLLKTLQEEQWEEALSLLYVGMTRAICYLDIVIEGLVSNSTAAANDCVAPNVIPAEAGIASSSTSLYTAGLRAVAPCPSSASANLKQSLTRKMEGITPKKSMAGWLRATGLKNYYLDGISLQEQRKKNISTTLLPSQQSLSFGMNLPKRPPLLLKRPPSEKSQSGLITLAEKFSDRNARARGIAKHAALAEIEWIEDTSCQEVVELQHNQALWEVFQRDHFFSQWKAWGVTRLEVWRERRFAVVHDQELLHGTFDRVVIGFGSTLATHHKPVIAEIIDFKTTPTTLEEKERRLLHYHLQLEEYRKALQQLLPTLEQIKTNIIWSC